MKIVSIMRRLYHQIGNHLPPELMPFNRAVTFSGWILLLVGLSCGCCGVPEAFVQPITLQTSATGRGSENEPRLKRALQLHPEAEPDRDGAPTEAEAPADQKRLRSGRAEIAKPVTTPQPTFADVKYGSYEGNMLDFWQAKSDRPTPVVVFIHGGGFQAGDKSTARNDKLVGQCLDAGVSFAAINYRYITAAPIQDVLRDCARAIQFIRFKAGKWNIDKQRIASYGVSAGAGTSLWLAFHDDLADPTSADPVLRESSRLACAGANATQFSYDVLAWESVFGRGITNFTRLDPALYGLKTMEEVRGPVGQKVRADCDMRGLITKDDPPVFLSTINQPAGEVKSLDHLYHHPKHAQLIYDRCCKVGVPVVANVPALGIKPSAGEPADLKEFLFKQLGVKPATTPTAKAIGK